MANAVRLLPLLLVILLLSCESAESDRWSPRAKVIGTTELGPVSYDDLATLWLTFYNTTSVDLFDADFIVPPGVQLVPRSLDTVYIPGLGHSRNVQATYFLVADMISPGPASFSVDATIGTQHALHELEVDVVVRRPGMTLYGIGALPRYVDYPTLQVDVQNTWHSSGMLLEAACWNTDLYELKTYFSGSATVVPGERGTVSLPYRSGYPYFISGGVACRVEGRYGGSSFQLDRPEDLLPTTF